MRGGRTQINIPPHSIKRLSRKRPSAKKYPFTFDTFIDNSDETDGDTVHYFDGTTTDNPESSESAYEFSRIDILRKYQTEFTLLQNTISSYASPEQMYDSIEEREAAINEIREIAESFLIRWEPVASSMLAEVTGKSIVLPDLSIELVPDEENKRHTIVISGDYAVETFDFTSARGYVDGITVITNDDNDQEGYGLSIRTRFRLTGGTSHFGITAFDSQLPVLNTGLSQYFYADFADKTTHHSPVELTHYARRREALESIETSGIPAHLRPKITEQLLTLSQSLENEDSKKMLLYENTTDFNDMAIAVAGDKDASEALSEILQGVVGASRMVAIAGPTIVDGQTTQIDDKIGGQVRGFISEHPWLDSPEPVMIIEQKDGNSRILHLVPLGTIEEFWY